MPSMSYCVFENILPDLQRAIEKADSWSIRIPEDASEYERAAFPRFIRMVKRFYEDWELQDWEEPKA